MNVYLRTATLVPLMGRFCTNKSFALSLALALDGGVLVANMPLLGSQDGGGLT